MLNYNIHIRPWENLANEIIMLAVRDVYEQNNYAQSALAFLRSDWGRFLCPADIELILGRIVSDKKMERSDSDVSSKSQIQKACKSYNNQPVRWS